MAKLKVGEEVHWERAHTCIAGQVTEVSEAGNPSIYVPGHVRVPDTAHWHKPGECAKAGFRLAI